MYQEYLRYIEKLIEFTECELKSQRLVKKNIFTSAYKAFKI